MLSYFVFTPSPTPHREGALLASITKPLQPGNTVRTVHQYILYDCDVELGVRLLVLIPYSLYTIIICITYLLLFDSFIANSCRI
jgi:hypothetical protein